VARIQVSDVAKGQGLHAPMGRFVKVPRNPSKDYRSVSAFRADSLYFLAWVDLAEPHVFSHPDLGNGFRVFEMTDLWTIEFETAGTRRTRGAAADYLLTGPGWSGTVPFGLDQIKSETRFMVILGRNLLDSSDVYYKIVNDVPEQLKLTPLSAWGNSFTYRASKSNPSSRFCIASQQKPSTRWIRLPASISW
jgi:hypothetical protein